MSYTTEEMRILINFHRQYNTVKTNHYLQFLEKLGEQCPDIYGEIEEAEMEYDNDDYLEAPEEEARGMVISMLNEWIATLQDVRERLKG